MVNNIAGSYQTPDKEIAISVKCEPISFNLDRAIPLGLIINEIVTNALKYAFQERNKGEINVQLKQQEENYKLIIFDTGQGFPSDFESRKKKSLGMELLQLLAEQLNGKLTIETNSGVSYTLLF